MGFFVLGIEDLPGPMGRGGARKKGETWGEGRLGGEGKRICRRGGVKVEGEKGMTKK